jgi:hypothetical protein
MAGTGQLGAYVARFGFNRKAVGVLLINAVFTVLAIVIPDLSPLMRVVGLLLFGVGGLVYLVNSLNGGVAFGADEKGITLGSPAVSRSPELRVPWSSIAEVVLFRQHTGATTVPYVGLGLRPGAPVVDAAANTDAAMWGVTRQLLPHVPEDVLAHSRAINGWRLDEEKLAQVLADHAPHVQIVHL